MEPCRDERRDQQKNDLLVAVGFGGDQGCLINIPGKFYPKLDWTTGVGTPGNLKTVLAKVGDQGDYPVCWAWTATHEAYAAILREHGIEIKDLEPLAVQDAVDHSYPGRRLHGGNPIVALEWISLEGVSEEAAYERKHGPYTGVKPLKTPPRAPGRKHKIKSWFLVEDNEDSMIAALHNLPLIINVPCYSGVVALKGGGLLDLFQAQKEHNPKRFPKHTDQFGEAVNHTMLLVGYGEFIPEDVRRRPINYWIIKNQWTDQWGLDGMAYPIRNSSLFDMHNHLCETEDTRDNLHRIYNPISAYYGEDGRQDDMDNILKGQSLLNLLAYVTEPTKLDLTLFYVFYDPLYCDRKGINVDQIVVALEKSYRLELDKIFVMVDLSAEPKAREIFGLSNLDELTLVLYLPPTLEPKVRKPSDGIRLARRYKFNVGDILLWLGDKMQMSPCPISTAT